MTSSLTSDNEYENAQFWRAKITITFVLKFHRLLHEDKVITYIISDLYSHVIVFLIWLRESALLTFRDISVAIYDVIMNIESSRIKARVRKSR
jgi:hypothetical protein